MNNIELLMITAAEQKDRKLNEARLAQLKESITCFRSLGMGNEQIITAMALTRYEWQRAMRG